MKRSLTVLLLACSIALAQTSNPLTDTVMARYKGIRQNLIESAEAMPDENYSFKLTPEQRTFAEWIGHTAMGNYSYCATIKGEKVRDTKFLHNMTGKAELSKALRESFEYCDAALEGMNDQKAMAAITMGDKKVYPVQGMIALVSSDNEHYGNIVGYMRSKGVTPPSTARAAKMKK